MRCPHYEGTPTKERYEMNLGENIKTARKTAGITQKQLAEKMGVYQKDVSRWENNEHAPTTELLAGICKALNTSADTLLEIEVQK